MTLIAILLVAVVASGTGVLMGRRRGLIVGIAWGVGVVAAGVLGYCTLLALALPM